MSVYTKGLGDQLVNSMNYNREINLFLDSEKTIFKEIARTYPYIIEAGCMNGRYLEEFVKLGKKYIGIDIVERYIDEGRLLYKSAIDLGKANFLCKNIESIDFILNICSIENKKDALIIFPFNSFGNMDNVEKIIKSISASNVDFIISTYLNDSYTVNSRKSYYINSGFSDIQVSDTEEGIRFISSEGLNSIAYHEVWMKESFLKFNIVIKKLMFSNIGIAYTNIPELFD